MNVNIESTNEQDSAFLRVARLLKLNQIASSRCVEQKTKEDVAELSPTNHERGWVKIVFLNSSPAAMFLVFLYMFCSLSFCFVPNVYAQTTSTATSTTTGKITLFAKTGSGDYYTLYPDGIGKEDAYIGGFKSVQLDPLEENIYFFDTVLKVIGKINLKDGKVYKVIGKPKSSVNVDYSNPVKFADASLGKITDFTFDNYGNIFILYPVDKNGNPSPRILKASLKDGNIKEVLNINDQFRPLDSRYLTLDYSYFGFNINDLSFDHDRFIYLSGSFTSPPEGFGVWSNWNNWDGSVIKSQVVLKFNPLSSGIEIYAGTKNLKDIGYTPKILLGPNNPTYFTLKGITFDHDKNCFLSYSDYINDLWGPYTTKLTASADGVYTQESFIGDGTGAPNDIGDGGLAKSAYATLTGSRCLCGDKSGDIFIADTGTNRVRKILKDSGLITTVAGGGTDTISFGQLKTPRSISLVAPNTLLVDKANNLYIAENNRILAVNNFVSHSDIPAQEVKVATISISKIAGVDVKDPKGEIALPDLTLDYTYSGDQSVEVKALNIPDGTNVKLLSVGVDGTNTVFPQNAKLVSGVASVPVKIEAGATKVIKAETDPFIPAPGVYLPGTEPKIAIGELLPEPQNPAPARDVVNLSGNLILPASRFNFSWNNWKHANIWSGSHTLFASLDPDNAISDATQFDFATNPTAIYYDVANLNGKNSTFTVWLRTDSGNANVLVGIGPSASGYDQYIKNNQLGSAPLLSYTTANVTPTWQKFTITSNANLTNYNKTLFISGQNLTTGQKVYLWGARVEQSQ